MGLGVVLVGWMKGFGNRRKQITYCGGMSLDADFVVGVGKYGNGLTLRYRGFFTSTDPRRRAFPEAGGQITDVLDHSRSSLHRVHEAPV